MSSLGSIDLRVACRPCATTDRDQLIRLRPGRKRAQHLPKYDRRSVRVSFPPDLSSRRPLTGKAPPPPFPPFRKEPPLWPKRIAARRPWRKYHSRRGLPPTRPKRSGH